MKRILIIEDNPWIAAMLYELLRDEGFDVAVAVTGNLGLEKIDHSNLDLVVLDLSLPETNGLTILQKIRKHPRLKEIPVLVYTGFLQDEAVELARMAGATRIVAKSETTPTQMVDVIRQHLQLPQPLGATA
jgi:two-component system chemotaxis response regulator CheY